MPLKTRPFDVAEHLQTDEDIKEFLACVITEGGESNYIHALNTAARAKGMTEIVKKAGMSRASLYKSLANGGNPRFDTIVKVTRALGCKLTVI